MTMFRLKVLTLLIIGFAQISFAQIQPKDSMEAYNYWAQRGVIEAVYAYMEDYVSNEANNVSEDEITGQKQYYHKFINKIDTKESLPSFVEISLFLKDNSWKRTDKQILLKLKEKIDKNHPLDNSFFNFYNGRNLNAKSELILSKYEESLKVFKKKEENVEAQVSQVNEEIDAITDDAETNKEKSKEEKLANQEEGSSNIPIRILDIILIVLCVFLIGLLFGSWLIYRLSKKRIYSILKMEKNNYLNEYSDNKKKSIFKYIGIIYVLRDRKNLHKQEKEIINNKHETLQLELINQKKINKQLFEENISLGKKLENKNIDNKSNNSEEIFDQPEVTVTEKAENQTKHTKKFFTMPNYDGSFNISNGDDNNDGKKNYVIIYEELSNQGELIYLPSDRDQRSINRFEAILKPVCDIINIANTDSATSIELLESGKVSLVIDKWVVDLDNKVKIKLN